LESVKDFGEVGAGIQCGPNITRLLRTWGLDEQLIPVAVEPLSLYVRRWKDGRVLAKVDQGAKYVARYGSPYWLLHRADYQRVLVQAAVDAGTTVRFGARVTSVAEDGSSVTLENGETLAGDLIIGCDGIKSAVRRAFIPERELQNVNNPSDDCYRAVIDGSVLLEDPEIKTFTEVHETNIWYGPGRHVVGYPVKNGGLYNLVLVYPSEAQNEIGDASTPEGLSEAMRAQFQEWDPK
jgi:salicylate hydroxylase